MISEDIRDTFPDAQRYELHGQPIAFLADCDGASSQSITFCPGRIVDVITEESQSNNSNIVIHCSIPGQVDGQNPQSSHLSSSSSVPFIARNTEQATTIKFKNGDVQQQILSLLLESNNESDELLRMQKDALDRLAVIHKQGTAISTQTYELHEYSIPRLFIVLPAEPRLRDRLDHSTPKFRLHFLCECGEHAKMYSGKNTEISHEIHLAKHDGYDLQRPEEFFQNYGRYMLTLLKAIKYGVIAAGLASPTSSASSAVSVPKAITQSEIDQSIKYLQGLADNDEKDQNSVKDAEADSFFAGRQALKGADFRHLETFIKDKDMHRVLGNLFRTVTPGGHVKWVCIDHYDMIYKSKEQLALAEAVEVNSGTYEKYLGQVVVRLGSKIRAMEFFDALAKERHVHDLDIAFDWECSKSDLEELRKTLAKSRVSILRLELQQFRTSSVSELLWTSEQCEELSHIMELPNMKVIRIVLPKEFIELLSLQPKRPSHLHMLSIEMVLNSIEEKEIGLLAEALIINETLTALNFKHSSIGNNGAQALSTALGTNSTLTNLKLENNSIDNIGARALSVALKINSTLTTLDLRGNSIGNDGARVLSKSLRINSNLTTLDLRGNSIGDIGAQALSAALEANSTLLSLNLAANSIGNNGAQTLSEALKINSTLTTLYLADNLIGDIGAQSLSTALKINSTLTTLECGGNSIRDDGAEALSAALKINSTLTNLCLGENSIRDYGAEALSAALKINSTLTTLDLGANSIRDFGAEALSAALKINSTLIILDLQANLIRNDGAEALSAALKINSTLTTLDLGGNSISDYGAEALSVALKINSTLTTLDLVGNSIRDYGAEALSAALKINSTLTTLRLANNLIRDDGAEALSAALKINSTLTNLCLGENSIRDYGAEALSAALKINSTLTTLDLGGNLIGENGVRALYEANSTTTLVT
ncbi:hypothetical protein BGZ98_009625 [Dissophora globulifera]|nr:hypothetical protein BGZ98_009625 [Dissophora globulifera]